MFTLFAAVHICLATHSLAGRYFMYKTGTVDSSIDLALKLPVLNDLNYLKLVHHFGETSGTASDLQVYIRLEVSMTSF